MPHLGLNVVVQRIKPCLAPGYSPHSAMRGIKLSFYKKRVSSLHGCAAMAKTPSAVGLIVPHRVVAILHIRWDRLRFVEVTAPINGIEQEHCLNLCTLTIRHSIVIVQEGGGVDDDGGSPTVTGHKDLVIALTPALCN